MSKDSSSDSDDSVSQEDPGYDDVVKLLESFKLRVSSFSVPNLAKDHGQVEELSPEQESFLKTLKDFLKYRCNSYESFMCVVQEKEDFRSFRVMYGQRSGSPYDYALVFIDVYVHVFSRPTTFLRTGHPDCNFSMYFKKNGLIRSNKDYQLEGMESLSSFFENFFFGIHSDMFMYGCQLLCMKKYQSEEIPPAENQALLNFLEYVSVKYGIYEPLKDPLPEFQDAIRAYFIIFRQNLKMHLETSSAIEGMPVHIPEDSAVFRRNPGIMQEFQAKGYNECQSSLYSALSVLLDSLPTPKAAYNLEYGNSAPVFLSEGSQNDPQPPESSSFYFQTLKSLRFNNHDFWSCKSHVLKSSIQDEGLFNTNRLGKEVKVLSQHLPCETTGAIFVVMDSERMDLMKALISGTEDTPYAHGLYEFHIACPQDYPKKPPLVNIVTTGKGHVRFNPNLYDDGYVCLSVINTWDGDPSERWNPTHSNILQVLLSIQVLVMDTMIIQKEPDFEYLQVDSWENIMYSNIVRYNNVKYAMLEMLKTPPEEFREVIKVHFALKRNSILETVDKWIEDAKDFVIPKDIQIDYLVRDHNPHTCNLFQTCSYYSLLVEARNELLKLLDSLPEVGVAKKPFEVIEITDVSKYGKYYNKMSGLIVFDKDLNEAGGYRHGLGHLIGGQKSFELRQERFEKDVQSLQTLKQSTLCNLFVCYDSARTDLLKVLVAGPMESDYADGLFLFELACPADYPARPPVARLLTTGRFTVSFSPCLSQTGEVSGLSWDESMSLKDFIFQLRDLFTKASWNPGNKLFSYILRYNTMKYAILDMVQHPPQDFKEVVKAHFQLKNNDIILLTGKWMEDFDTVSNYDEALDSNATTVELFRNGDIYSLFEAVYSELIELNEDALNDEDSSDSDKEKEKKDEESAEEEALSEDHKAKWADESDEDNR